MTIPWHFRAVALASELHLSVAKVRRLLDSSEAQVSAPSTHEGERRRSGITQSRQEHQYQVDARATEGLAATLAGHLPCTLGGGGGVLVTTVYFDAEDGRHLRASEAAGFSDRLRLREYPASAERPDIAYFIERKCHLGRLTEKARRRVGRAEAAALLANRRWAAAGFGSLAAELGSEPLLPVLVVQYRRQTFTGEDCRITLDRGVSFYAPLAGAKLPLAAYPGTLAVVEPGATVEVKLAGPGPGWLASLFEAVTRHRDSKFVRGCHAVFEHTARRVSTPIP